jgi:hypothetical protein
MVARTGAGAFTVRTATGTTGEVTVTNGDGVGGPPTYSLPATLTLGTKVLQKGQYQNSQGVVNALGSITGSNNVDLALGSVITATITGNTTLVFGTNSSYAASGVYQSWEVRVTMDASHTLTLQHSSGNSVTWDRTLGSPTLAASKVAVIVLETTDGGANVTATYAGSF